MAQRGRENARRRTRRDGGAALVEFALILTPLVLLLFGIIEFGWAFFQLNDVRHGAREGIRLVAVDASPSPDYSTAGMTNGELLAQAACERMDRHDGVTIEIDLTDIDSTGLDVGDDATLTASKPLEQVTHALDPFLNGIVLEEVITTRLEQSPSANIDGTTWACQ